MAPPSSTSLPTVELRQPLEESLRLGHPWVFADAVRHDSSLEAGQVVDLVDGRGQFVARGVLDPQSPLRLRVWTLDEGLAVDEELLAQRIKAAARLRPFPTAETNGYRLLHGEGDRVPGLVCDVYGEVAVLRPDGLGAERWVEPARRIIGKLRPEITGWVVRRSARWADEGAGRPQAAWLQGSSSGEGDEVWFREHGMALVCDVLQGQKTGFFLDQRSNRQRVARRAAGRRVLNLFGYTGAFSLAAAMHGAAQTTTVDLAEPALEIARRQFERNGIPPQAGHSMVQGDVFDWLEALEEEHGPGAAPYEVAVCDPPSFVHRRRDLERGEEAYRRLFRQVLRVMPTGSRVALASCSSHVDRRRFLRVVAEAARQAGCALVLEGVWGAGVDHPVLPGFAPGDYLQFCLGMVARG